MTSLDPGRAFWITGGGLGVGGHAIEFALRGEFALPLGAGDTGSMDSRASESTRRRQVPPQLSRKPNPRHHKPSAKILSWVLSGVVLIASSVCWGERGQTAKEIEEVKRKIEREQKSLRELKNRKGSVLDMLDQMDQDLQKVSREHRRLEKEISDLEEKISRNIHQSKKLEQTIEKSRAAVNDRVVALYKLGELGTFKILFAAESFSDLLHRSHLLRYVIREDLELLAQYKRDMETLQTLRDELATTKSAKESAMTQAKTVQGQLLAQREEKVIVLGAIENEEDLHKKYIVDLEEAQEKLEKLMETLAVKRLFAPKPGSAAAHGFPARKGTLKPPLKGPVLKKFGKIRDPKYFTYQFHKGVDLGAKGGSPIRTVYDGKVVFAGWFKGFGEVVIIDHGEGYHTLIAHAEEVLKKVGEEVREGEVIAHLSAEWATTPVKAAQSVLYFEVREHGKSVDPLEWLARSEFM